jgi:hypothetical protein
MIKNMFLKQDLFSSSGDGVGDTYSFESVRNVYFITPDDGQSPKTQ